MKPTIKRQVAVTNSNGPIFFFAVPDIANQVAEANLGDFQPGHTTDEYMLFLDPRYDTDEVVAWLKSLGE
jgi:hypothetical protein